MVAIRRQAFWYVTPKYLDDGCQPGEAGGFSIIFGESGVRFWVRVIERDGVELLFCNKTSI